MSIKLKSAIIRLWGFSVGSLATLKLHWLSSELLVVVHWCLRLVVAWRGKTDILLTIYEPRMNE